MLKGKVAEINRLIVGIANGRVENLNDLYNTVAGHLIAIAKVYLTVKSKAEDVVSDVFLIVVKKAKSFNKSLNGFNWLYEITKNTAMNVNRVDARVAYDELTELDCAVTSETMDIIDLEDDKSTVTRAMKELDGIERRVIFLRYWENKTVREIAKEIGKPTMTTNDLLKRTIQKLKNVIDVPYNSGELVYSK